MTLEDAVREHLRRTIRDVGEGRVQLTDASLPDPSHGRILELRPLNPRAAKMVIVVASDREIEVTIGEDARGAIPAKRSRDDALDQLRSIVEAVADGNFRETYWVRSDDVIASRGQLRLPSGRHVRFATNLLGPFVARAQKIERKYEAW